MSQSPIEGSEIQGFMPLGEKPHLEERIFKHLHEISFAVQHMAKEHGRAERMAFHEEIHKRIAQIYNLIPGLPSAKMVDAYDCIERIEKGEREIFADPSDATRTHDVLNEIAEAYRDFNAILNWEKEG